MYNARLNVRTVDSCREDTVVKQSSCLLAIAVVSYAHLNEWYCLRSGSRLAPLSLESSDSLLSPLGSHLRSRD